MSGKPGEDGPTRRRWRWRRWALPLGVLGLVVAYAVYVQLFVRQEQGLSDLFRALQEQGYAANVGLSGAYRPGNVIQTAETGPDGRRRELPTPLVFLWGETCFADRAPRESTFALPESTGARSASLDLAPQALSRLLPELNLRNAAVADYTLSLENTRVLTYARADLSESFAEECVRAWSRALGAGDRRDWFEVIVEVVVADSLVFEVQWTSDSSLEARAEVARGVEEQLAGGPEAAGPTPEVEVEVEAGDEKTTVIRAEGLVVLGYRARPMELTAEAPPPPDLRTAFEDPESGEMAGRLAIRLQEGGTSRRVGLDHRFRTGDRFQLEITSSEPGWLYVLHRPPGGEMDVLWPPAGTGPGGATHRIARNQTYLVPPDPGAFVFDDQVGEESFYVALQSSRRAPAAGGPGLFEAVPSGGNIRVRGDLDALVARGVTYDPGGTEAPSYVYFSPTGAGDGTVAALEFQLRHEG